MADFKNRVTILGKVIGTGYNKFRMQTIAVMTRSGKNFFHINVVMNPGNIKKDDFVKITGVLRIATLKGKDKKFITIQHVFGEKLEKLDKTAYGVSISLCGEITKIKSTGDGWKRIKLKTTPWVKDKKNTASVYYHPQPYLKSLENIKPGDTIDVSCSFQSSKKLLDDQKFYFEDFIISAVKQEKTGELPKEGNPQAPDVPKSTAENIPAKNEEKEA